MTERSDGASFSLDNELDAIQRRRPTPPTLLFKYVGPDRVDVLANAQIRFTQPLNTNDIFEVRQTFDLVMGPKMLGYFKEMSKEVNFDEQIAESVKDSPLGHIPVDQLKAFVSAAIGGDFETVARAMLGEALDQLPAYMNMPENIDKLLERVASNQLLLSLSKRPDSSPMWAHYAANSTGFVIVFDTTSAFFRRGDRHELQGLHKVEYFDGRVPEIADNPYAALISKQSDWAHEQEWRLYVKSEQVSEVRQAGRETIHLVNFPRDAVRSVILGLRASQELEDDLRRVLETAYVDVPLMRLKADRSTAKLIEEPA